MGVLVWSPLAMGLLTGRYRKGEPVQNPRRMRWVPTHLTDERKLDAVEELIPLADEAGLALTHLAMAFAVTHPGVTSAIIGPRTMGHLDDLLAGAEVTLDDEILDRIDRIVPPGTDIGPLDVSYVPPAIENATLRRRSADERAAG
jgi:aryl-alcohol dehydrogenase-like predicted oxidoreductase